MNIKQLYKNPNATWLETGEFCPQKVTRIRKILENQVKFPTYDKWEKSNEFSLITDLAVATLPDDMYDIKLNAQILLMGYALDKFKNVSGIDAWKKEYEEFKENNISEIL